MKPQVSVISVLYSDTTPDLAQAHLSSLIEHTDQEGLELIVALNAVQSKVEKVVRDLMSNVLDHCLINSSTNRGLASALNAGISIARAPWIATLAHDVVVLGKWTQDDWLRILIKAADENALDSIAPQVNRHPDVPEMGDDFWCLAMTCCCRRKSVYERIGLFDTQFDPFGFEDEDFGVRENDAQIRRGTYVSEQFPIYHPPVVYGDGSRDVASDFKLKSNETNLRKFLQKWPTLGSSPFRQEDLVIVRG